MTKEDILSAVVEYLRNGNGIILSDILEEQGFSDVANQLKNVIVHYVVNLDLTELQRSIFRESNKDKSAYEKIVVNQVRSKQFNNYWDAAEFKKQLNARKESIGCITYCAYNEREVVDYVFNELWYS